MESEEYASRWTAVNRRRGVPPPSSEAVAKRMRSQGQRDTGCERAIRHELHSRGLRYRVDCPPVADLRRRADLVFPREQVAVFVDGCFWHGCPDHGRPTKANAEWWADKIARTRLRDGETTELLEKRGFLVMRIWEHEDAAVAADRIEMAVRSRRPGAS